MTELIEPYRVGVGVFSDEYSAATACTEVLETAQPDPQRAAFYTELFALYPDGQVKFPHPWPPQIPPGRTGQIMTTRG